LFTKYQPLPLPGIIDTALIANKDGKVSFNQHPAPKRKSGLYYAPICQSQGSIAHGYLLYTLRAA